MRSELKANQALADYNQKEWEQRQAWVKVLAAPVKPMQRKVIKQGFFAKLFKVV